MAKPPRNRNVTEPQHREIEQKLREKNFVGGSVSMGLDDLYDVTISSPTSSQYLRWNGSNWINSAITLSLLSDINISAESDNDVLQFDFGLGEWVNQPIDLVLDDISNVSATSPGVDQVLRWNGSAWVPATLSIPSAINDLSDVTITGATSGQHLEYNGSAWVNATPSGGSLPGLACYGPGTSSPQNLTTGLPDIDWGSEQYDRNGDFSQSSGVITLPEDKKILIEWTLIVDNPEWDDTSATEADWAYMRWEKSATGTGSWSAITSETTSFYIWSPHYADVSGLMPAPSKCYAGSFVYDTTSPNVRYLRLAVNQNSAGTTIDVIACHLKLTILE